MLITFIIPTRERPTLLFECVRSIYDRAERPEKIEVILIADDDDQTIDGTMFTIKQHGYHPILIKRQRTIFIIRDYHNMAAKIAEGSYLWSLNDDCIIKTPNYDHIIGHEIESRLATQKDRILYVYVDDDTHTPRGITKEYGCCFPIFTKETHNTLNCLYPPEINSAGADYNMHYIFKSLKSDRMLDISDKIKLEHLCHHNGKREVDDTQRNIMRIGGGDLLRNFIISEYVRRLNSAIISPNTSN